MLKISNKHLTYSNKETGLGIMQRRLNERNPYETNLEGIEQLVKEIEGGILIRYKS